MNTITLDQLFDLPLESVVIAEPVTFDGPSPTVLHRTGIEGWLITRDLHDLQANRYHHEEHLRPALKGMRLRVLRIGEEGEGEVTDEEVALLFGLKT